MIEDAAAELFAEHGYAETRLKDIAAAAGVTKQLLYQHFRSKKDLYLALLARHRDGLLGRLAVGMARPGPLVERIRRTTDEWFAYFEENPAAPAILFRDAVGDAELQALLRENHATARGLLVALVEREADFGVPEEQVEPLAEFYRSAGAGLALWWAEHPEVPRATVVEVCVSAWLRALGLEGSQSSKNA